MKSAKAIPFTVAGNGNDKVHALQHELYRAAKQASQRWFHALYDTVWLPEVLWRAWVIVAGVSPGSEAWHLRMPPDERCRKAVCGRPACTV